MDKKSHLTNISRSLNEPDEFLKWRMSVCAYAEALPEEDKKKFSYGLGIFSVVSRAVALDVSEPYTYQWVGAKQGARVMRWAEAIKEADFSTRIASLFETQKNTMLSNYFFALSAALFLVIFKIS